MGGWDHPSSFPLVIWLLEKAKALCCAWKPVHRMADSELLAQLWSRVHEGGGFLARLLAELSVPSLAGSPASPNPLPGGRRSARRSRPPDQLSPTEFASARPVSPHPSRTGCTHRAVRITTGWVHAPSETVFAQIRHFIYSMGNNSSTAQAYSDIPTHHRL